MKWQRAELLPGGRELHNRLGAEPQGELSYAVGAPAIRLTALLLPALLLLCRVHKTPEELWAHFLRAGAYEGRGYRFTCEMEI